MQNDKVLEKVQMERDALRVKYEKMSQSSFAFFRGNAKKFFEDLAKWDYNIFKDNKLLCWVQGDAHLYNVGFFNKNKPDSKIIRFDMNDFDESYIGSNLLDVIRFTVSITFFLDYLNNQEEFDCKINDDYLKQHYFEKYFVEEYLKYLKKNKFYEIKFNTKFFQYHYKKAKNRLRTIDKLRDDEKKFILEYDNEELNLIPLDKMEEERIKFQIEKSYGEKYKILDIAKRVKAGVGSAHLNRYYALVIKDDKTTILIEAKEQTEPSIKNVFDLKEDLKSKFDNKCNAEIFIDATENIIDDFDENLQIFNYRQKNYILKSLFNVKYTIKADKMCEKFKIKDNLKIYLKNCAKILSNTHKKTALEGENFIKHIKFLEENELLNKNIILEISNRAYQQELENFEKFIANN